MKCNPEKTNKWRVLVKTYNESDITMKEFCQIHKVNVHQLQYWLKKFKHELTKASFVKVINPIYQTQKPLTIDFQDLRINIPESYNESTLTELIKTLRRLGDER
jgi:transposase-like protein